MIVRDPKTEEEFTKYYDLRWRILREPWGQARGSERDEYEESAIHMMVCEEDGIPIGVGRAHFNSPEEAQIRYMAVEPGNQGKGIGGEILKALETRVKYGGGRYIVLNSREKAVPFYQKHGYQIIEEAHALFEIPHFLMRKNLD